MYIKTGISCLLFIIYIKTELVTELMKTQHKHLRIFLAIGSIFFVNRVVIKLISFSDQSLPVFITTVKVLYCVVLK